MLAFLVACAPDIVVIDASGVMSTTTPAPIADPPPAIDPSLPDAPDAIDAGAEDMDAEAPCVPCSEALLGHADFEAADHGRTYADACPQSAVLWAAAWDASCMTSTTCFEVCKDSLCQDGFASGNCLACIATHVTEPAYDACAKDP